MKSKTIIILSVSLFLASASKAEEKPKTETGKASFYGQKFHNRKTASGTIYNQHDFTCAHRHLPFGTKLLVRNPENDRQVIVRVTDRGPSKRSRIIDLSLAAARTLGIVNQGVATVEISRHIEREKKVYDIPRLSINGQQLLIISRNQSLSENFPVNF
ncbi:MAG TPA: septal ring lytic transglycosylase RlpA family lipoprotein [Dysgonomonas sp.]|nr:septal ring lytic transglycosylase RlpA family lipoprotein [Dysgonomonas sp.]